MRLLEEMILSKGKVYPGNILKVDSFLNHQIDSQLMFAMAQEFQRLFRDEKITKVMTIEASGIAIAVMTAYVMQVPMVFAKKSQTKNLSADVYSTQVMSFTHGRVYDVKIAKEFINSDDKILIVDDFLANGVALEGLCDLVNQAGASVVGAGIAIEKGFQDGGNRLRAKGLHIESLAIVQEMNDNGTIKFLSKQ